MKRLALALAAGTALIAAVSLPSAEPANACSLACDTAELQLELVEVRLVQAADGAAELPEAPHWAELAVYNGWGNLWDEEGTWMWFSPLDGEVTK